MQELLGARGYFIVIEVAKQIEQKPGAAVAAFAPIPGMCPRVKAPSRKEELRDSKNGAN